MEIGCLGVASHGVVAPCQEGYDASSTCATSAWLLKLFRDPTEAFIKPHAGITQKSFSCSHKCI